MYDISRSEDLERVALQYQYQYESQCQNQKEYQYQNQCQNQNEYECQYMNRLLESIPCYQNQYQ